MGVKLSISSKVRDRTGERFGRLLVIKFSKIEGNKARNAIWDCLCDCGNHTQVRSGHLVSGTTKSCGCLASELSRISMKKAHTVGKHLYVLRCAGYTKIGRSSNPKRRWYDIQADNPLNVELVDVLLDQGEKEKELHEKLKEYHHKGEWFKLPEGCEVVDLV